MSIHNALAFAASRAAAPAVAAAALALVASLGWGHGALAAGAPPPRFDRAAGETPSKQPVPRFVSLRFSRVNARSGPDLDYPIRWVYTRRGLPVRVTAETDEWRRIQDPDGAEVWVHKRTLEGRRTAVARPGRTLQVAVRREPASDGRVVAQLADGVIAEIVDEKPGWRLVQVGRIRGWAQAGELWGAQNPAASTARRDEGR